MSLDHEWEPCVADPVGFNCRQCHRWPDPLCRYLIDDSLRDARAAECRDALNGGLKAGQAAHIVAAAIAENVRQGMPVSAGTLQLRLRERFGWRLEREAIERALSPARELLRASTASFRPAVQRGRVRRKPRLLSSGSLTRQMLQQAVPMGADAQRPALARLAALRTLKPYSQRSEAMDELLAIVDQEVPALCEREGWTIRQVAEIACGVKGVGQIDLSDMERKLARSRVLSAVAALEWISRNEMGSVADAYVACKNDLVVANMRLVDGYLARGGRANFAVQYVDKMQEGAIGLMRALEKFSPYWGYAFSTYAWQWIRQGVARAVADTRDTVRVPVHAQEKRPRPEGTWHKYECIERVSHELFADEQSHGMQAEMQSLVRSVAAALGQLGKRDQEMLAMRFGIGGASSGQTLEQIGERYGLSRERIRQIESAALARLKVLLWDEAKAMGMVSGRRPALVRARRPKRR